MSLIVQKYGGSSLTDIQHLRRVARRVVLARKSGHDVAVVVSAMGSTTNAMCTVATELSDRPPARELDALLATGECYSAAAMAIALDALGCAARSFAGWQAGFVTDNTHGGASIIEATATRIRHCLDQGVVPVVAGFQGVSSQGDITTLGRGGSDTTAVALAITLGADQCEIYTDVDGVFTADPRADATAYLIRRISYEDMHAAATNGAKVLHPRCVEYAWRHLLPIHVRSSFHHGQGTWVGARCDTGGGRVDASVILTDSAPLPQQLATNDRLRDYVQERLAGQVRRPDETPVPGPVAARWKGRSKPRRQDRRWVSAWSPKRISHRLRLDFPDDDSMRISHEATDLPGLVRAEPGRVEA